MLVAATSAWAGEIVGTAADATGAVLPAAQITLRNQATGAELFAQADLEGRFRFPDVAPGRYLVTVESSGFARDSKTVTVDEAARPVSVAFALMPGGVEVGVTVTATRSERDVQLVPLRADGVSRETLETKVPLSTGDALLLAPGVTPVGNGPMQVRPRLRGLDSTRVLILVDGERLNNARTATDRAGTEVGLIDLSTVDRLEVVSGAGSVLYGTDALAGTVNIITNQPRFSDALRFTYGLDTYVSSNENGRRGSVMLGATGRRFAVQFSGGVEAYDNYVAGAAGAAEDTTPYYTSGQITAADTIDSNFGFSFKAFPDPFNQPYVRSSATIPTSGASGSSINTSALVALTGTQTLQMKYIGRRMDDVGFPDFQQPVFFSAMTLPYNNLDRYSAKYEARSITPWFTNLAITGYYQDQRRLLRNEFPVQFPVPSPAFFPINVYRLNLVTDTEQRVRTPGIDAQATFVPARKHVLTAGLMVYSDGSRDSRTNATQTTIIGNVGARRTRPAGQRLREPDRARARRGDASGARAERVVPRHRPVRAGRVGPHRQAPCGRRPARGPVPRRDRGDAGLRRAVADRRRRACDPGGDAARRRRRSALARRGDRRHRRRLPPQRRADRAGALRPQLPPRQPRGVALLGAGHRRRDRAQHDGRARSGEQRRPRPQAADGARGRLADRTSSTPTTGSSRPKSCRPRRRGRCRRRSTSAACGFRASRRTSTSRSSSGPA